MKKVSVVILCVFSLILFSGCTSARNLADNTGEVFQTTGKGISSGTVGVSRGFVSMLSGIVKGCAYTVGGVGKAILAGPKVIWEEAKKADQWLQDHAW
ncbi:MAG: hypothetical protein ABIH71_00305 [Candidatus Omnitrophota bacterium]|nr:hypothetical protein [Candidatus Omnitrophota bacterium]